MPARRAIRCPTACRVVWLAAVAVVAIELSVSAQAQPELASDAARDDFAATLELAGIGADRLAIFSGGDDRWTPQREAMAAQLLFRLRRDEAAQKQFDLPELEEVKFADAADRVGHLFSVSGSVVSIQPLTASDPSGSESIHYRCEMQLPNDSTTYTLFSASVPSDWVAGKGVSPPIHDVRATGVLLAADAPDDAPDDTPRYVMLAERFQWRPVDHPVAGVAWLARQGMDAGLLDDVQHGRALVKPNESRESAAFFACLAIMRSANLEELTSRARHSLQASLPELRTAADQAERRWQRLRASGKVPEAELDQARKRALLREAVLTQAERGLTSVAPLFLAPSEATGQFVLIEGVARRAVRVAVNDGVREVDILTQLESAGGAPSIDQYYQVEVFTPDSQNLPVVCCVAALPTGFPTGEVIHEPVRVAGVFFKKWAYQTRREATRAEQASQLGAAPIVIAPSVALLRMPDATSTSQSAAVWGGAMCLLGLAALWAIFWRVERRDRRARQGRPSPSIRSDP